MKDDQRHPPSRPAPEEMRPEQAIDSSHPRAPLTHRELLAKREVLEHEILPEPSQASEEPDEERAECAYVPPI
ncbi:MAG: hypothetical protein DK306_001910 [Chloroflexi bacterium]|jgi:hypothetical protein|nr:MAG: hypothetical protein DK306_001910 [Chloroflexota bacterium]